MVPSLRACRERLFYGDPNDGTYQKIIGVARMDCISVSSRGHFNEP